MLALRMHDELRIALPRLRRVVPAIIVSHWAAALIAFWPTAWGEVAHAGRDSSACDDLAREHDIHNAIVFVNPDTGKTKWSSWTGCAPMPSPRFDDDVLFPRLVGTKQDIAVVARYGANRGVYVANCIRTSDYWLKRYDPATGRISPLEEQQGSPRSDQPSD